MALLLITLFGSAAQSSEQVKSIEELNLDLSLTKVSVTVTKLDNEFWEYLYDIHSPAGNKGKISSFSIDMECAKTQVYPKWPEAPDPSFSNNGQMGKHTRAMVYAPYGIASFPRITRHNRATWAVSIEPGESASGLRVISPSAPGVRKFKLEPSQEWKLYDYEFKGKLVHGERVNIPHPDDFIVVGEIDGPSCEEKRN